MGRVGVRRKRLQVVYVVGCNGGNVSWWTALQNCMLMNGWREGSAQMCNQPQGGGVDPQREGRNGRGACAGRSSLPLNGSEMEMGSSNEGQDLRHLTT